MFGLLGCPFLEVNHRLHVPFPDGTLIRPPSHMAGHSRVFLGLCALTTLRLLNQQYRSYLGSPARETPLLPSQLMTNERDKRSMEARASQHGFEVGTKVTCGLLT